MTMIEGISESLYQGLRGKWKRSNYERLDGSHRSRRRKNRVELASEDALVKRSHRGGGGRRIWKIKVTPKMRFFAGVKSPKKSFQRLRDWYVKMMIGFANSRIFISGYGGGGGRSVGFSMGKSIAMQEYNAKVILEIYKSILADQGRSVLPADATARPEQPTPIGIACSS